MEITEIIEMIEMIEWTEMEKVRETVEMRDIEEIMMMDFEEMGVVKILVVVLMATQTQIQKELIQ